MGGWVGGRRLGWKQENQLGNYCNQLNDDGESNGDKEDGKK